MNLKGVDIERDVSGKIKEIRFNTEVDPQLISDIWRFIKLRARQEMAFPSISGDKMNRRPITRQRFRELIRESKASGELSETAFFQKNPSWLQKREELFSPNSPMRR